MYKETVISLITIILIIVFNSITTNYTKESFSELTTNLLELKNEMSEENIESEKNKNKINHIFEIWESRYKVLAYYLEHDELEKAHVNMTAIRSAINSGEYPEAMHELEEMVYILNHIEEKNKFDLKNVF